MALKAHLGDINVVMEKVIASLLKHECVWAFADVELSNTLNVSL